MKRNAGISSSADGRRPGTQGSWATRSMGAHQLVLTAALLLTAIAYFGTLGFEFVYDDRGQVIENPWVHSWRFVPRYFTTHVWGLHNPNELGNYYRPVFLLWLRFNDLLFGLKPWGWHLTSVLLHLGVTLLVYVLARRILTDRMAAAVAALLFGLHPVHIESVAWVSGVTEPLMAVLLIPAFLCYVKKEEHSARATGWLAVSVALFSVALLAKETALVLPMLIFLYEWFFRGGEDRAGFAAARALRFRRALGSIFPYLAVIPLYLLARAIALKGISHTITPLPISTIAVTWPSLLWFYLKLLVWPARLSVCYDTPYATQPGALNFMVPGLGVAAAGFLVWAWAYQSGHGEPLASGESKARMVAFASAWLVLPVVPLLNLRYLPLNDIAHDRYMYLPSVGFVLIVALALRSLRIGRSSILGWPAAQMAAVATLGVVLAASTVLQSLVWADDLLLYSRGVSLAPNNRIVKINLANVACERGLYQAGIKLYEEVIQRNPDFWLPYYDLGYTYYRMGNLEQADKCFSRAVEINILSANSFLYLGLTRLKMGRLREAVPFLRQAIEVSEQGSPGYHFALGYVLKIQGDLKGALNEFEEEVALDPGQQAAKEQIDEIQKHLSGTQPGLTPVSDGFRAPSHARRNVNPDKERKRAAVGADSDKIRQCNPTKTGDLAGTSSRFPAH